MEASIRDSKYHQRRIKRYASVRVPKREFNYKKNCIKAAELRVEKIRIIYFMIILQEI